MLRVGPSETLPRRLSNRNNAYLQVLGEGDMQEWK